MVKFTAHFSGVLGDKVLVCGGCRALGNWEPDVAPALAWGEGDVWTATLELPPGTWEFKVGAGMGGVLVGGEGGKRVWWGVKEGVEAGQQAENMMQIRRGLLLAMYAQQHKAAAWMWVVQSTRCCSVQ
jgi:hypothetical protein